jgi:hypothetical protein
MTFFGGRGVRREAVGGTGFSGTAREKGSDPAVAEDPVAPEAIGTTQFTGRDIDD